MKNATKSCVWIAVLLIVLFITFGIGFQSKSAASATSTEPSAQAETTPPKTESEQAESGQRTEGTPEAGLEQETEEASTAEEPASGEDPAPEETPENSLDEIDTEEGNTGTEIVVVPGDEIGGAD